MGTLRLSNAFCVAFVTLGAFSRIAFAAPCCAGSSAAPSIISGDDSAQMSVLAGRATVIGDAPAEGIPVFRAPSDSEVTQTYRIDGAILLSDRFQAGMSVPFVIHSADRPVLGAAGGGVSANRFGDIRLSVAYEALPEWGYSRWKPKGYVFFQATLPTGRSIYDSIAAANVDATGRGFYTGTLGMLIVKRWSLIDAFLIPEVHYSATRSFWPTDGDPIKVFPGWGTSLAMGIGYSPSQSPLRLGLTIQPIYNQPKLISASSGDSISAYQLTWDTALDASYLISSAWSVTASYSDQTLLGPAVNSTLSRSFALSVRHGWER